MRFPQRKGIKPIKDIIQINSLDEDTLIFNDIKWLEILKINKNNNIK